MAISAPYSKIYRFIIDSLENGRFDRRALISAVVSRFELSAEECEDCSVFGVKNNLRSRIGSVINDMETRELIANDSNGLYYLVSARPVIVRIERCEKEILKALTDSPMTKGQIREHLVGVFGTDKTASQRDDDTLLSFMGRTLKQLLAMGVINCTDGIYSLSKRASARADDMNAMLALRSDFISALHAKGGEFFENYFMKLLSRYSERHGKRIVECYVTGGSADGGIDGIMKTEDALGFRETVMVQTKNRVDIASETDVRGFWGAVCAKGGSRGIYATTSDFHSGAEEFAASIDNCVCVNGHKIFKMAMECSFGIRKSAEGYIVDLKKI